MVNNFTPRLDEFGIITQYSSRLRKLTPDELQNHINNSTSLSNAIARLQICVKPNYLIMIRQLIKTYNIDLSKMKQNRKNNVYRKFSYETIFCENSTYYRKSLKKLIIENSLIKYQCSECGIIDMYNNKPIVLQIDHINGNNIDNRLENLRFLCPMCHSQTSTYAGKNIKRTNFGNVVNTCKECGVRITKLSIRCQKCSNTQSRTNRKFEIPKEELEKLIKEKPMTEIGKIYGVSGNAIKKRCKKLKIELKSMLGYWTKQQVKNS